MKLSLQFILVIAVFIHSITLGIVVSPFVIQLNGYMFYHRTYIKSIDTPSYGVLTKTYLNEFNNMADGGIVHYNNNSRPVYIEEQSAMLQILYPNAIGLAFSTLTKCNIYIQPGLEASTYRETLIHEYLHCFDYPHSPDPKDLMYYLDVPIDKEENIKYYARDLKRKYYESRFYRF